MTIENIFSSNTMSSQCVKESWTFDVLLLLANFGLKFIDTKTKAFLPVELTICRDKWPVQSAVEVLVKILFSALCVLTGATKHDQ